MTRFDDPRFLTLLGIGIVAAPLWWMLAVSIGGMEMSTDLTPGVFAGTSVMWILMMLAMMLPAMAPVMVQYAKLAARETTGPALALRVTLFGAGYFALWGIVSVVLAGVQLGLARTSFFTMGGTLATPVAAGILMIVAGLWQLTPIKDVCLTHCRRPLAYLIAHWREGMRGAFPMGAGHGAYCVGCCVALMGLMFVFGAMNVVWMAVIAAYFVAEKIAPAAERWSRPVGAVLIAAGIAFAAIGVAEAKTATPPEPPAIAEPDTLPRCGAQIGALAWFFEGVRDSGRFRAQQQVDGLLSMRAALRGEAARRGADHLDRLHALEKSEIEALQRAITTAGADAPQAIDTLRTGVEHCAVIFFERDA